MYWPGRIPPSQVNREIVSALDIFPTLVEVSGAKKPNRKLDGENILPLLTRAAKSPRTSFLYCREKNLEAFRLNEWKLRVTAKNGMELYNLHDDPGELYNQAEELPEKVKELMERMKEFAEETQAEIYEGAFSGSTINTPVIDN